MFRRRSTQTLEEQLKDSIRVNALVQNNHIKRPNPQYNGDNKKIGSRPSKTAQVCKGRAPHLMKYPLQSVKLGEEPKPQPKPKPAIVRKNSTQNFIEKLKTIESITEKTTFLDQTNEELEIASRQLDEIQKLIERKCNEHTKSQHKSPTDKKCQKQIDRKQQKYLNKTRIHYKSLQDIENFTQLEKPVLPTIVEEPIQVLYMKTKNQGVESMFGSSCTFDEKPELKKKHIFSLPSRKSILKSESSADVIDEKAQTVKFKTQTLEHEYCFSDAETATIADKTNKEPKTDCVERTMVPRTPFKNSKVDSSILNPDYEYLDGRHKLGLLLYGDDESLDETRFDDAQIEESVLKSAYLSKEFAIDFKNGLSKGADKKGAQLLETVLHKFQDRQPCKLANLKGRDRKLYSTLNTALKDTLYSEIRK